MHPLPSSYIALFLAPLLMGASTFFRAHGEYGIVGGTVLAFSTVFWIICFAVLFGLLARKRVIPGWIAALIVLGAVAFPVSRIPRIEWIAHTADGLLALPFCFLGYQGVTGRIFDRTLGV